MGGIICTISGALATIGSVIVALYQSRFNFDDDRFSWTITMPVLAGFGLAMLFYVVGIGMMLREREKARLEAIGRDAEITAMRATLGEIRDELRKRLDDIASVLPGGQSASSSGVALVVLLVVLSLLVLGVLSNTAIVAAGSALILAGTLALGVSFWALKTNRRTSAQRRMMSGPIESD